MKIEPSVRLTADDIANATEMDFRVAGFTPWDEPDINNQILMLVPLWLHPFIDVTLPTRSIRYLDDLNVTPRLIGEIDVEHREGSLAYGFLVNATPVEKGE